MKKQMKKALFLTMLLVCLFALASCMMMQTAHTCVDRNGDGRCDTCSQAVAPTACTVHIDNNGDGLCDRTGCGAEVLQEMFDVTFKNLSKTYSGKEYTIEVEDAPEGAVITYDKSNTQVNAGTYKITATITADGYQETQLTATLTIKPKNISIAWGEFAESYPANGKAPELPYTLNGVLEGDEVEVELDFGSYNFKDVKTVKATAVSKNPNYNIKTNKTTEVIMGENVHKVTFDSTLNNITINPETVLDGTTVKEPRTPSKFGHTFTGWYNGETKWDFSKPVTEPMNLVAGWQLSEYKIEYVTNGGSNPDGAPERFTIETTDSLPVPQKENSIFLGWFTDAKFDKAAGRLGSSATNLTLYAKWSDYKYVEIEQGKEINSESNAITLSSTAVNGNFTYVFSATVNEFAEEDGVIRIGRGKDTLDGSYVEFTKGKMTVYIKTSESEEAKIEATHILDYDGFIIVEIRVTGANAVITLRTADGSTNNTIQWSGRNGEIFFESENADLENASFGWTSEAYDELVWIVGDETVGLMEENALTYHLNTQKYGNYLAIGAKGLDSKAALDIFKDSYEKSLSTFAATPKYAIWSFRTAQSETYDADLADFIAFCTEKGIVPILSTQPSTDEVDNTARNEAVKALVETTGIRYIDFASINDGGAFDENKNYTVSGARAAFAKFMVGFPEIVAAASTMRTVTDDLIEGVSADLMYPDADDFDGKYSEGYDYSKDVVYKEVDGNIVYENGQPVLVSKYKDFENHRLAGSEQVWTSALTMKGNSIKNGKYMIFSAKIDGTLDENETILIGQGYMQSTGKWIEINGKNVLTTGYQSWGDAKINPSTKTAHELTIKNYITVIITVDVMHSKKILIFTDGGYAAINKESNGNTGDFFVTSAGIELKDVSLSWTCSDYAKDIWVFGDSYLSMGDTARWPTYLWNKEKYYNALMDGKSGMQSEEGLEDFEDALQYGVPKYVVWLEGMNDSEKNGNKNNGYHKSIARVFELCEQYYIMPIIATIPNCYKAGGEYIVHHVKNQCIREGLEEFEGKTYRIIEWAAAVEDAEHDTYWYEGMLHTDYVHPTILGAKSLYMQLATDFPEIFGGWNGEVSEESWAEADTLTSGASLTVKAPTELKASQIFTFSTGFAGRLSGTIEIGNGKNVEGGTWVSISATKVTVYQRQNGDAVEITRIDNDLEMNNLLNLKIHVKDGKASIVMASSGEKVDLKDKLFGFSNNSNASSVSWNAVGDAFVTVNGAELTDVSFCWYTVG